MKLSDDERERREEAERQRAMDRLERAPRGPSIVDSQEERRLYELNREGVDAPIKPRPMTMRCPQAGRHEPHVWQQKSNDRAEPVLVERWCTGS